jgi:hypothetical protein
VEHDHEEDFKEEEVEEEEEQECPEEEKAQDENQYVQVPPKKPRRQVQKNHPPKHIIGNKDAGIKTRRRMCSLEKQHLALLSTIEKINFEEENKDEHWIKAIYEKLDQIKNNGTWKLVPILKNKNLNSTKWLFIKKLNEDGQVAKNKERLVCKGYIKVEGIYFQDTFSPFSRMEAIGSILSYVYSKNIHVY